MLNEEKEQNQSFLSLRSTLNRLAEVRAVHRISALPLSAQAHLLAAWATQTNQNLLVLGPNEEVLADLEESVQTISKRILKSELSTLIFPCWEGGPYSLASKSNHTRADRTRFLTRLLSPSVHPTILFTTPQALFQRTLSLETLRKHSVQIGPNRDLSDRKKFALQLQSMGYEKNDPVEEIGQFAVRGEILDLFPPDATHPYRIELFDTLVERVRRFDPFTQKTFQTEIQEPFTIYPAREVLFHADYLQKIKQELKRTADDRGITRQVRDPIVDLIHEGATLPQADLWGAFIDDATTSGWNNVLNSPYAQAKIVLLNSGELKRSWESFLEKLDAQYTTFLESGSIAPEPKALFPEASSRLKNVKEAESLLLEPLQIEDQERTVTDIALRAIPQSNIKSFSLNFDHLTKSIQAHVEKGDEIKLLISSPAQKQRLIHLFESKGVPHWQAQTEITEGALAEGYYFPEDRLFVLSEAEPRVQSASLPRNWQGLQALADINSGDLVVHFKHGIGIFKGLQRLKIDNAESDFIQLEYAGNDKLYLPTYRLNTIQKYYEDPRLAKLDKLGSGNFEKTKDKVREEVKKLAFDLIELYAQRSLKKGETYSDTGLAFEEFESRFPYQETPDQLRAIEETLKDLSEGKVMDRLVCGDVGFGKTEIALRAAWQVVMGGGQVAVLVPTTVLALQHETTFTNRFKGTAVQVRSLSRFVSRQKQKETLTELSEGKVDILIGTHRLLSKDIKFRNLGLLIIDEEHRFGVEHKEKLKSFRVNTHVLTLTATPIPRTLQMAVSGIRDISLITTPPVERYPIKTILSPYNSNIIKQACETELARGGQIFFIHNRVETINKAYKNLSELLPQAKIVVAHAQMKETELEKVMLGFYKKEFQILLSTSIIESGLDIPSANTIIIERADTFGLAQLYQLRGRVGRSNLRAYAYLLLPEHGKLSEIAEKRLSVIQRFVELGSGFSVASHDLELRGGGNLLGAEQSGHIAAVGFDLYMELLNEAVDEIRGRAHHPAVEQKDPEIKSPFATYIDDQYIPDIHQRLSWYRRLSLATEESELDRMSEEIVDRYGKMPEPTLNVLWTLRIKRLLIKSGIQHLTIGENRLALQFEADAPINPSHLVKFIHSNKTLKFNDDRSRLIYTYPAHSLAKSLEEAFFAVERLIMAFRERGVLPSSV